MAYKGPIVRCEVTDRCTVPARNRVSIAGIHAVLGPPVNCCRRHRGIVIDEYLAISYDVRIRGVDSNA